MEPNSETLEGHPKRTNLHNCLGSIIPALADIPAPAIVLAYLPAIPTTFLTVVARVFGYSEATIHVALVSTTFSRDAQ